METQGLKLTDLIVGNLGLIPKDSEEKSGIKPVETKNLLGSIMSSDMDNSGSVSKSELSYKTNMLNSQLNYMKMMKAYFPYWGEYFDNYIDQAQTQLDSLTIIKDNFDAFSKSGDEKVIDGQDIMNVIKAANTDENINDFSQQDLDNLKPEPKWETSKTYDLTKTLEAFNDPNGRVPKNAEGASLYEADGKLTKEELNSIVNYHFEKIDKLQQMLNDPRLDQRIKAEIVNHIEDIKKDAVFLNNIKNNFDVLSQHGEDSTVIDATDIQGIKVASQSDGDYKDFSKADLDALKVLNGTEIPEKIKTQDILQIEFQKNFSESNEKADLDGDGDVDADDNLKFEKTYEILKKTGGDLTVFPEINPFPTGDDTIVVTDENKYLDLNDDGVIDYKDRDELKIDILLRDTKTAFEDNIGKTVDDSNKHLDLNLNGIIDDIDLAEYRDISTSLGVFMLDPSLPGMDSSQLG